MRKDKTTRIPNIVASKRKFLMDQYAVMKSHKLPSFKLKYSDIQLVPRN